MNAQILNNAFSILLYVKFFWILFFLLWHYVRCFDHARWVIITNVHWIGFWEWFSGFPVKWSPIVIFKGILKCIRSTIRAIYSGNDDELIQFSLLKGSYGSCMLTCPRLKNGITGSSNEMLMRYFMGHKATFMYVNR